MIRTSVADFDVDEDTVDGQTSAGRGNLFNVEAQYQRSSKQTSMVSSQVFSDYHQADSLPQTNLSRLQTRIHMKAET